MSAGLLLFVGAIYAIVACDYARQSRYGMALAFVAYSIANECALANVGYAWDLKR